MALSCDPDYVVLSGSLAENPLFVAQLSQITEDSLHREFFVLPQLYKVKGAALGAAYLVDGIVGGENAALVDILEIRRASGTCLDYLCLNEELKIEF